MYPGWFFHPGDVKKWFCFCFLLLVSSSSFLLNTLLLHKYPKFASWHNLFWFLLYLQWVPFLWRFCFLFFYFPLLIFFSFFLLFFCFCLFVFLLLLFFSFLSMMKHHIFHCHGIQLLLWTFNRNKIISPFWLKFCFLLISRFHREDTLKNVKMWIFWLLLDSSPLKLEKHISTMALSRNYFNVK